MNDETKPKQSRLTPVGVDALVRAVLDSARALVRHSAADDFWSDYQMRDVEWDDEPTAEDEIYPAWANLRDAVERLDDPSS